jgi:polysaccharide biosynthesis protein PslG
MPERKRTQRTISAVAGAGVVLLALGLVALLTGARGAPAGSSGGPTARSAAVPKATGPGCNASRRGRFVGLGGGDSFDHPADANCVLGLQASSGVGYLRHDFRWEEIERSPGRYDFSGYDRWVRAVAAKRMGIMAILFGAPPFWVRTQGNYTYAPRSNRAFANYAAAVVRRYGSRGSFWRENPGLPKVRFSYQVWNEPNLRQYWLPRPNPRRYTRLLKAAARAIKRVERRARILTAGLPNSTQRGTMRYERFIARMYRAGGKSGFDTLAVNAYAPTARGVIGLLRSTRRLMRRYHDSRASLWLTEVGWGTGGPRHRFNLGSRRQAREISRLLRGLYRRRRGLRVRGLVYFGWQDRRPYPPRFQDMWGLHTGLFTLAGEPKRSYRVFRRIAPRLR